MQRTLRSFIKNVKERENVAFFWKERMPNPAGMPLWLGLWVALVFNPLVPKNFFFEFCDENLELARELYHNMVCKIWKWYLNFLTHFHPGNCT